MTKDELLKKIKVNDYLEWGTALYSYSFFLINKKDIFNINDNISVEYIVNEYEAFDSVETIEDNPSHLIFERNEKGDCISVKSSIYYIKSGEEVIYGSENNEDEVYTREDVDYSENPLDSLYNEVSNHTNEPIKLQNDWSDFSNYEPETENESESSFRFNKTNNDSDFIYNISSEYLRMTENVKPNDSDFNLKKNEEGLEIKISVKFK